jgi:hypothetical protein
VLDNRHFSIAGERVLLVTALGQLVSEVTCKFYCALLGTRVGWREQCAVVLLVLA